MMGDIHFNNEDESKRMPKTSACGLDISSGITCIGVWDKVTCRDCLQTIHR